MKLKLQDKGSVDVAEAAFGAEYNEALVHQVVTAYLAGARAGTIRSPIWVGGGRAFAAQPRNHDQKVNKKMYRAALRSVFGELIRQDRLVIVKDLGVEAPTTQLLATQLTDLDLDHVLILNEAFDEKVFLAARNLPNVGICDVASMDPVVLIRFEKVLVTLPALKLIEERLS